MKKAYTGQGAVIYRFFIHAARVLVFLRRAGTRWPFIATCACTILLVRPGVRKRYGAPKARFEERTKDLLFTYRWFYQHIPFWLHVLARENYAEKTRIRALEVGSWEGMSSLFLLQYHPGLTITCVDTWEGGDEHAGKDDMGCIERRFDANLAPYADRIEKFKGTSFAFFNQYAGRRAFDLIYIDGSHYADDVLVDAVKGFEMLVAGGIMIFDDVPWRYYPRLRDNPIGAINAFLELKKGCYRILQVYSQLIIRKTGDAARGQGTA